MGSPLAFGAVALAFGALALVSGVPRLRQPLLSAPLMPRIARLLPRLGRFEGIEESPGSRASPT